MGKLNLWGYYYSLYIEIENLKKLNIEIENIILKFFFSKLFFVGEFSL